MRNKLHKTTECVHLVYFAAVFVEAHGYYGLAGGALFVLGLVAFFAGEEV